MDLSEAAASSNFGQSAAKVGVVEPIAIIGLAFQFPQGAVTEDAFWDMLVNHRNTSTEYPKDRLNIDAFYSKDPKKRNTIRARCAHFLENDIRDFDAPFFGMSPAEAGGLDPQQRGLLETTYHAIENAGIPMNKLAESKTSVHVGSFSNDFMTFTQRDIERIPKYNATGCSQSLLSNRISWFFNIRGTSLTVDTACSSSLVALDLACRELWSGQASMAIAAGASVILSPEMNISLSNMGFLSPDGKCFSFDHRGNGYGRGEGFAALILKPISQALRDGDTIRALIRSTGTNQDGHTPGITQPNKDMQAELIKETYRKANLDMGETRYFEAHGTGTAVGDPIEARAIGESFRMFRSDDAPLYVGAVKSNLGHLEGCSGLAGVIKAVLALERGIIPPNTNFEKLNEDIDDEFFHLKFPLDCVIWPGDSNVRRASVNSFGYGGTNAHVVLDDVGSYLRVQGLRTHHCTDPSMSIEVRVDSPFEAASEPLLPKLLIFSAADKEGIGRQADIHSEFIRRHVRDGASFLDSYAYTLAKRRTSHAWKSFCVMDLSTDVKDLALGISAPTQGLASASRLAFVFTGQGAQWFGMGSELLVCPIFRDSINASQTYLAEMGWSLSLESLLTDKAHAKSISEAHISQPLTTSIQIALVDLAKSLDIVPSTVVGHSSGEIAAAYCACHISHSSAMRISYFRGLLSRELEQNPGQRHSMVAVGLSVDDTKAQISGFENSLGIEPGYTFTVSCINSPVSTTVSGPEHMLDALLSYLSQKGIFARQLKVGVGYHSPQMLLIAPQYSRAMGTLQPGPSGGKAVMVSSVTGTSVDASVVSSTDYWVRNMVSPVNFLGAISACSSPAEGNTPLLDGSHLNKVCVDGWLEIGPHSTLQGPIKDICVSTLKNGSFFYTSALLRNRSAIHSFLAAVGNLHCHNFDVDLQNAVSLGCPAKQNAMTLSTVPSYPFNHSTVYWDESQSNQNIRFRLHAHHGLLGTRINESLEHDEVQWKFHLNQEEMPWVKDHRVQGAVLYPAGGTLVMVLEAANQLVFGRSPIAFEICNVDFPAPVEIPPTSEGLELRVHLSSSAGARQGEIDHSFRIFVHQRENRDKKVCSGSIRGDYGRTASDVDDGKEDKEKLAAAQDEYQHALKHCSETVDAAQMYQELHSTGLQYGAVFQALDDIHYSSEGQAFSMMHPFDSEGLSPHVVHPSRLDGVFQLGFAAMRGFGQSQPMVPTRLAKMRIHLSGFGHPDGVPEAVYAKATGVSQRTATFSFMVLSNSDLQLKAQIHGLEMTALTGDADVPKNLFDAPYLHSYFECKPDLDTMESSSIQDYCKQNATATPLGPLGKYLDCLAHKYPNLSYCAVGAGEPSDTHILDVLAEVDTGCRFEKYVCTDRDVPRLEEFRKRFKDNRRVHFKVLDMTSDSRTHGIEPESFDVVILEHALEEGTKGPETLDRVRTFLKSEGKLIFKTTEPNKEYWDESLRIGGFSGADIVLPGQGNDPVSSIVSTASINKPLPESQPSLPPVFVLDKESSFQETITQELSRRFCPENASPRLCLTDAAALCAQEKRDFILMYELENPLLYNIAQHDFQALQALMQHAHSMLWVTQGRGRDGICLPEFAMTKGLCRVSAQENVQVALVVLALELDGEDAVDRMVAQISTVFSLTQARFASGNYEYEYTEVDGRLCISRLTRAKKVDESVFEDENQLLSHRKVEDRPLEMTIRVPGVLDTIAFIEDESFRLPLGAEDVEIKTRAIGLNFKDGLALLGRVTSHSGCEYSGIVTAVGSSVADFKVGDRVVNGLRDSFRTRGRVPANDLFLIPDHVSFEEAAAIPTVFRTAYFCLYDIAKMRKGESILIHRAAGGTGQAAIQLAQEIGAEIYATVGSLSKKKFLIEHYGILEDHIFYSRDTSFADGIKRVTKGRGVDVVLNSLTGRLLIASWEECMAPFGRFVEIGMSDVLSRGLLPMHPFLQGVSFTLFNLDLFASGEAHNRLMGDVWNLLANGKIRPPAPLVKYPLGRIESAIRFLNGGESSGKIVITANNADVVPTISSKHPTKYVFPADATYVIAGGLGGIGRMIARWLSRRGAKHLILLSRSGTEGNEKAQRLFEELTRNGVQVICPAVDITDLDALQAKITNCLGNGNMPPIRGCFQGAMVLRDSTFTRMSIDKWRETTKPKVQGSWNLHRVLPSGMDFFVLLSSIVGVFGNGGQSNYAAGSVFEDELARFRVRSGEKAVSMDLGMILEDGVVAENEALKNNLLHRDIILPVPQSQLFSLLDRYCDPDCPLLSPKECQVVTGINLPANVLAKGKQIPPEGQIPLFRILHQMDTHAGLAGGGFSEQPQSFKSAFTSAATPAMACVIVAEALRDRLSRVLGMPIEEIQLEQPLENYGIDSLVGLEIRNYLAREMGTDLAVFEIQSATLSGIARMVSAKSLIRPKHWEG